MCRSRKVHLRGAVVQSEIGKMTKKLDILSEELRRTLIAFFSSWASYTGASMSRPRTTLLKFPLSSEDRSSARSCERTRADGALVTADTQTNINRHNLPLDWVNRGVIQAADFSRAALPQASREGVASGKRRRLPANWGAWEPEGVAVTQSFCLSGFH